jgi:alkaline phosphatase D
MSPETAQAITGLTSTVARLSAYAFLQWIPGHHFPPIILSCIVTYLACIFYSSAAFGSDRPTLAETFPKLFGTAEYREENKEDEDHDQPILYNDEKTTLKILLLGIPDWREAAYSYTTILINVILAALTLDLIFRAPLLHPAQNLRFSRIGFVDATYAKVLFREPDSAQLPVYAYLKAIDSTTWNTIDRVYYLDSETDYTHPLAFTGLTPETTYIYSLSNDLSGTFTTSPAPYSPAANSLTFLTSSCIKANFPYRPFSHSLAIHGFDSLSTVLRSLPSPASFMLFLGDFIYVDVPIRLSSSYKHYRAEYRRVYASPSWSLPGLSSLPWYHTLDDHEIANDWSGGNDTAPFPAASDPFIHYHVSVNPPVPPKSPNGPDANTTYFQYTHGPASFFMLDTRRYRTEPEPKSSSLAGTARPLYGSSSSKDLAPESAHTMLGEVQLRSLLEYLSTPEPHYVHWKIVASSVPFTKNWRFGTADSWGGYLHERSIILEAMHKAERNLGVRVVILSGDRHEFAALRFPPPILNFPRPSANATKPRDVVYDRTAASGPHEFSVGPLSMFYLPFRTFKQVDDEDVAIKYIPDGNSKLGAIEIKNLEGKGEQRSIMKYSLWINGKVEWEYTLTSPAPAYNAEKDRSWQRGYGLWG